MMSLAEAARLLELPPQPTLEQIQARFLEQRARLEEKAANALTPKLQEQYRAALARTTEAYEMLVMEAEGLTPPAAEAPPPKAPQVSVWGALLRGMLKAGFAVIAGSIFTYAVAVAVEKAQLLVQENETQAFVMLGVWFAVAALPALAWWIRTVRRRHLPKKPDLLNRYAYVTYLLLGAVSLWYCSFERDEEQQAGEWLGKAIEARDAKRWREAVLDAGIARGMRPKDGFYARIHEEAQHGWIEELKQRLPKLPATQAYAVLVHDPERPTLWLDAAAIQEYHQLFAATFKRLQDQTSEILQPIRALTEQGQLEEARAALAKLQPFPRGIPDYREAADQIDRAEVRGLLQPALKMAVNGGYIPAYSAIDEIKPKPGAAQQMYTEILLAVHYAELQALLKNTQELTDQKNYEPAQDSFAVLEEAIGRMSQVPGFAGKESTFGGPPPAELLEQVRTFWRTALIHDTAASLAQALTTDDAALAQDAIDEFTQLTGQRTTVTGQSLLAAHDFPSFVSQLGRLGLNLPGTKGASVRTDLVLLEAAASRLGDAGRVHLYLGRGYRDWAKALLDQGSPGLALFALHEAVRLGDSGDAALAQAARKKFIADNAVTVVVESAGVRPAATTVALRTVVRDRLVAAVPGLVEVKELKPGQDAEAGQFVLNPDCLPLSRERGQEEKRQGAVTQTDYHFNYQASLVLAVGQAESGANPVILGNWTAALRYSTWQMSGHSAPHAPVFVGVPEAGKILAQDLSDKLAAQSPAWLLKFAGALQDLQDQRGREQYGSNWQSGDWQWGWREVWADAGVRLPEQAPAAAARENLGLPPREEAAAPMPAPPAGWQVENSLGMRFAALPKTPVLFSIWETRIKDFAAFVTAMTYRIDPGMTILTPRGLELASNDWQHPGFDVTPEHAVCGVSWNDATEFCQWLTDTEHKAGSLPRNYEYRLPTEQEWSDAAGVVAGGGTWPRTGAGNLAGWESQDQQWPAGAATINEYADGFPHTAPVGWFSSNAFGLYDLDGNVAEWCAEPADSAHPQGAQVIRGTAFVSAPPRQDRFTGERTMRHVAIGFRVVMAPVAGQ